MAHWYACLTRARSEKKVAERLTRKQLTTYLPLIPREREWSDRTKVVEWPVFPSYVFCRVEPPQMTLVLRTPGVAQIVHHAGAPAVIRDEEMENVRRVVEGLAASGQEPEPTPDFRTGQPVRVIRGPFEGVTGRVREVRGRKRLLVGIAEIGQGLEVDIPADALESLD
jgi:transcription antitermination factor NusG